MSFSHGPKNYKCGQNLSQKTVDICYEFVWGWSVGIKKKVFFSLLAFLFIFLRWILFYSKCVICFIYKLFYLEMYTLNIRAVHHFGLTQERRLISRVSGKGLHICPCVLQSSFLYTNEVYSPITILIILWDVFKNNIFR